MRGRPAAAIIVAMSYLPIAAYLLREKTRTQKTRKPVRR
jgi:hypothetical protein